MSRIKPDLKHVYIVDYTKYMIAMHEVNQDNFQYRKEAIKYQGAETAGRI
ncbi:MAG: hypothetical protein ACI8RH_001196 [Flavobacteriales bacterium]|jgi:hypothetical protein